MTPLKCDLCGSQDIVKEGEYFVCQHCGTKYSLETAKQMMFGGTVTVDNSNQVQNYLTLAKREREKGKRGDDYIWKVLELDPNNIEALEMKAIDEAYDNGHNLSQYCDTAEVDALFKLLDEDGKADIVKKLETALHNGISDWSSGMLSKVTSFAGVLTLNGYKSEHPPIIDNYISKDLPYWNSLGLNTEDIPEIFAQTIYKICHRFKGKHPNSETGSYSDIHGAYHIPTLLRAAAAWTQSTELKRDIYMLLLSFANQNRDMKEMRSAQKELDAIDPDWKKKQQSSNSGCYVATAVYGSYDCPEVWTLRRFRDYDLAETWYGRAFIRTYYAISPAIVNWFGKAEWFSYMWRPVLDRMVRSLKAKGYEDTPYNDRNW